MRLGAAPRRGRARYAEDARYELSLEESVPGDLNYRVVLEHGTRRADSSPLVRSSCTNRRQICTLLIGSGRRVPGVRSSADFDKVGAAVRLNVDRAGARHFVAKSDRLSRAATRRVSSGPGENLDLILFNPWRVRTSAPRNSAFSFLSVSISRIKRTHRAPTDNSTVVASGLHRITSTNCRHSRPRSVMRDTRTVMLRAPIRVSPVHSISPLPRSSEHRRQPSGDAATSIASLSVKSSWRDHACNSFNCCDARPLTFFAAASSDVSGSVVRDSRGGVLSAEQLERHDSLVHANGSVSSTATASNTSSARILPVSGSPCSMNWILLRPQATPPPDLSYA